MKLTAKQEAFCREYLIDLNATQAAIRAGYSTKTATEQGARMLTKVKVQEFISELQKNKAVQLDISHDRIIKELVKIAFGDVKNYFDHMGRIININELSDDVSSSIKAITVISEKIKVEGDVMVEESIKKVESYDKLKAIDLLNRMLGYYQKDNDQRKPDSQVTVFQIPSNNR